MGRDLENSSTEAATQLVRCYLKLGKKNEAQEWFDKIKEISFVRFGSERAVDFWHIEVIVGLRNGGVNIQQMMGSA